MKFAHGEDVTVRRQTGKTQDGDGNDIPVFTGTAYEGVTIGPGTTVEASQGQSLVANEIHAIFIPQIPLTTADRIDVLTGEYADSYAIDGMPKQYRSPRTGTSVTDAKLLKVTG